MRAPTTFYHYALILLVLLSSCQTKSVQKTHKFIIEMVDVSEHIAEIQSIAKSNGASDSQLYQWENHVVLYTFMKDLNTFGTQLKEHYPEVKLKVYEQPFYVFSKASCCGNASLANECECVILTANLVKDTALQQEYIEHHRTQFEKWPEVAQGFCNANFQQLLVYRNGRQLMLVISIPADKTLDELNPKTVENNPRMDEWNAMMAKYQEGIEGSSPDETWVFLNAVE